jgi:hypothetical protein
MISMMMPMRGLQSCVSLTLWHQDLLANTTEKKHLELDSFAVMWMILLQTIHSTSVEIHELLKKSGPFQPSKNRPKNQPKIAKTRLKCLV